MYNPRDEDLVLIRNEQDQIVAVRAGSDAVTQLWPLGVRQWCLRDLLKMSAHFTHERHGPNRVVRRDLVADLLEIDLRLV
jgi:hypothetical protein